MKNKLINNKKGNATVIISAIFTVIVGFGLLVLGNYLYFAVAASADAGTLTVHPGRFATGSFTFTGNVTNGELVNITNGAAVYIFEFNTTNNGSTIVCQTTNCIPVNLSGAYPALYNHSWKASGNLTAAINGNASVSALVTAVNTTNLTTLTSATMTANANSIAISTNAVNVAASGATLTNGATPVTGQTAQNNINNYVVITLPLMGLALMILGFGVIFITLKGSFGAGEENR